MSKRAVGFLAVAAVSAVCSARGAVTFNFNYTDAGTGFNDPTAGAERRSALSQAAGRLSQYLGSYTATVDITVSSISANNSLLGTGSSSIPVFTANNFRSSFVQSKILTGSDINGASADGSLQFNFFHDWGYGDTVTSEQYDFQSVAMHELIHTMGFGSYISGSGQGAKGSPSGQPDTWGTFDRYLATAGGTPLITADFRYYDPTATGLAVLTGDPGVYWMGAQGVAAHGGPVPMYSPSLFLSGSSLDHPNELNTGGVEWLMNPSVTTGLATRELSAVEIGMLKDIGYTAVPELDRIGLVAGLGLVVYGWRRRRAIS